MEHIIPVVEGTRTITKDHLPSKTEYNISGGKWSFDEIGDFQAFLMKIPELKRNFDFQMQESREA